MTSIAALQCVERGQIGLDDDVSEILPELKEPEILEGYEDGSEKPTLKRAREKITLRSDFMQRFQAPGSLLIMF